MLRCITHLSLSSAPCIFDTMKGAVAVSSGVFETSRLPKIDHMSCIGTEMALLDCNYTYDHQLDCHSSHDAGVVCQGVFECR